MRHTTLLTVLAAAVLGGCAGTPAPPTDGPPPDFSVSVTVVDREESTGPALARSMRPARFIVEPDWVLRASVGPGSRATTYPPAMRTLSRAQVMQLWQAVNSAGYLATDARTQVTGTETRTPEVQKPTALVYVCGNGVHRSVMKTLDAPDAGPTRELIDRLSGLAWVER